MAANRILVPTLTNHPNHYKKTIKIVILSKAKDLFLPVNCEP